MAATNLSNATTEINFVCQRCLQPLKLDSSFQSLDKHILHELTAPLISTNSESIGELLGDSEDSVGGDAHINVLGGDGFRTPISIAAASSNRSSRSQDGFTLLEGSDAASIGPASLGHLSHTIKVTGQLFDIMSGKSDVDHPLCEECTDSLLDQLDQQLKITEDECREYKEFLEEFNQTRETTNEEELDSELEKLREEEQELKKQLDQVEQERQQVKEEIEEEKKELSRLKSEEEQYWRDYCSYKRQLIEYEDEQASVDNQLKYSQAQLDKLKKTNVFNTTFHIWHSGHFGTINNFRLGRLPNAPVEWSEINAAWGQTVLLLHSLAQKMNLKFERYRLVPFGNHSYMESLADKSKELPLYGSGGFRFLWDTKFDQAMVAFLDCLQQFKVEVEKGDSTFCLPYSMSNGKIEDGSGNSYSIRTQFNSEEQWTKALKYMLTNLKWGLAWVSSQFADEK